jgi:hypothetical protein
LIEETTEKGIEMVDWLVVWNQGILNDFPETVGNFIIPTDELHHFSEG